METTRLNGVLEEVGKLDGIPNLRLSGEGTAAVQLKDGGSILFEYQSAAGRLLIYTPLLPAPRGEATRLYFLETMMKCNFLKLETGDGELAFDGRSELAVYQIALDANRLDVVQLDRAIDELLDRRDSFLILLTKEKPSRVMHAPRSAGGGGRFRLMASLARNA